MDAYFKRVPQEGTATASGGESLPLAANARGCPMDSGEGKSTQVGKDEAIEVRIAEERTRDERQTQQPKESPDKFPKVSIMRKTLQLMGKGKREVAVTPSSARSLEWDGLTDPFKRRDSILRTPDKGQGARGDADEVILIESEEKEDRKRPAEESPEGNKATRKKQRGRNTLCLLEVVESLRSLLKEHPNTQKDIKAAIKKALFLTTLVRADERDRALEEEAERETAVAEAKPAVAEVGTQTEPERIEAGTQTSAWNRRATEKERVKERDKVVTDLSQIKSLQDLRAIRARKWKEDLYKNVEIKVGTFVASILGQYKLKDTEAMRRGRILEDEVLNIVMKEKKIKCTKTGIYLN